jgi:hypothetical protein
MRARGGLRGAGRVSGSGSGRVGLAPGAVIADVNRRSRRFVWTFNNYQLQDGLVDYIKSRKCSYLIFGKEVGESGTPHLQGYIEFGSLKTKKQVVKLFKPFKGVYVEHAVAGSKAASDYCKKDDDEFFEIGKRSADPIEKAKRGGDANMKRYKDSFEAAKCGNMEEIPADLRVRFYKVWKEIRADFEKTPDDLEECCGVWIWGPSGSGKSHMARGPDYCAEGCKPYDKSLTKWWDKYNKEDVVLLDDVDPLRHQWLGSHIKRWADKYAFPAEVKFGFINIRPKTIIVTSQYPLNAMFPDVETYDAVKRRFKVVHIPEVYSSRGVHVDRGSGVSLTEVAMRSNRLPDYDDRIPVDIDVVDHQ